jgi:phytanoyl-CoA hydroxylase
VAKVYFNASDLMVVSCHQDSVFLYTDPPSAVGFWFALEDCTTFNGCLSFVPGSHKTSPITKRLVRMESGTGFINIGEDFEEPEDEDFKVEECSAGPAQYLTELIIGTLVIIHGNVLHKSEANRSLSSRYIYTFHVIEGEAEYDEKNWYLYHPSENSDIQASTNRERFYQSLLIKHCISSCYLKV